MLALVFIAINAVCFAYKFYYVAYLPLLMAIGILMFLRLDNFLLLIIFLTPLSIPLFELVDNPGVNLTLPAEPFIIALFLIVLLKQIQGEQLDKAILKHPVSIAIYINLFWIFITSISSTMPLVSFKFFASRLWMVVIFYFFAAEVFKKEKYMNGYTVAYLIALVPVIVYTFARHISIGLFSQQAANSVMNPFYRDHTSYGAVLAMLIPMVAGFIFDKNRKAAGRIITFIMLAVLVVALVFSYTRAAWVSLIGAACVFLVMQFRIKFTWLAILGVFILYGLLNNWESINQRIEKNRQSSSSEFGEHVQSITNISSDVSNMERINRWSCAIRMFKEKPILGWGPGTYMFTYAPFQVAREKTEISTNAGDRGNAHSEYLGPLSESGVLGMLSFLIIMILVLYKGINLYFKVKTQRDKIWVMSLLLGLITYFVHGLLNNFLDTIKASALFWGFIAMLVAIEMNYNRKREEELKTLDKL